MALRSEPITDDSCGLQRRWRIHAQLADMLVALEAAAQRAFSAEGLHWPGLFVISGYRREAIRAAFNPLAPAAEKSLHRRCPALAVDLRVGDLAATTTPFEVWSFLGFHWKALGGRWGGDFQPAPDPNHFEIATVH